MRIKTLLIFVLAGFCLAGPANAGSRFVVLSARHSFSVPHIAHNAMLHNGAILRNHRRFFGGAEVTYDPLLGAGYPIGPDYSTGDLPSPPYPPEVYYPAYYAPQPHCVQPKIIYLTDEKPVINPPRIIYGSPPQQCP
jgi:hypothetical protein